MNLTPLPALSLRDLADANPASIARTPGLHVTDVIQVIMSKLLPPRAPRVPAGSRDLDAENWQEAGFVWEELLSGIFAARAGTAGFAGCTRWRPGELKRDGIIGSPDAICADPDLGLLVEEYKCTWKSSKNFDLYDKRYLRWLLQIQAYCTLADVLTARLFVLHINGSYDGYIPQTTGYRLEFTAAELADSWTGLVNTAKSEGMIR